MSPAEARNLHERCALDDLLHAQPLTPEASELLRRLDCLVGEALMLELDRVLRIVGLRLVQEGQGKLFEEIYAAALDGCQVDPGAGRRFLRDQLADLQP